MRSRLVLGNRNYSTWSLRAWWMAKRSGMEFEEIDLKLDTPGFASQVARYSPSGRVPVLHDDGLIIWDTLAIAEYLAEKFPAAGLWPDSLADRAFARSMCSEMHSGFPDLRGQLPMNCRASNRVVAMSEATRRDILRIMTLWGQCRQQHASSGKWLFGRWSIADAFFAPVVLRFKTYDVEISPEAGDWVGAVLDDPDIREWLDLVAREPEVIEADEAGVQAVSCDASGHKAPA